MRAVISLEQRFERTRDGAVWTDSAHNHSFWTRYLHVFDSIAVLARVAEVQSPLAGTQRADGAGVVFPPFPWYLGPAGYLRSLRRQQASVRTLLSPDDAVIMRLPSPVSRV